VQKFSGDAATALPAAKRGRNRRKALARQTETQHSYTSISQTRETQGRAQDNAKITTRRKSSEWSAFWKNLLRRYRIRRLLPNFSYSGAGEGIRTPDPLITNQMLYRLSYASNSRESCASAQTYPSDPCQMSGTIN
jgi:hypothetical protein